MSYLQRYVSMFAYIFPYAAYEDMRSLSACPGLPMEMRRTMCLQQREI